MTEEQFEVSRKNILKLSAGLLGTAANPTQLARFLNEYIEIKKEETVMSGSAERYVLNKAALDALISLCTDIRELEKTYKEQQDGTGKD